MIGRTNVGGGGNTFAFIVVTYPEGSVCTCTDGTRTIRAKGTTGSFVFNIPYAGAWTVSCTNGVESDSKSITISVQGKSYNVELSYDVKDYELYYDFENPEGTTVFDRSGNNNNGAISQSSVTFGTGIDGGQAVLISGTGKITCTPNIYVANTPFTISAWLKYTKGPIDILSTANYASGSHSGVAFYVEDGETTIGMRIKRNGSDYGKVTTQGIGDDQWHHIVATSDNATGGKNTIFIDAVKKVESGSITNVYSSHSNDATIGNIGSKSARGTVGIDGVRLYRRILTSAEITKLYTQGRG